MRRSGPALLAGLVAGLVACTPQPALLPVSNDNQLTATLWRVEDLNGAGIMDYALLSIDFSTDGRVSGDAGCNSFTGSYEIGGAGEMKVGPLISTRKLCSAEALMLQERRFLDALGAVERYEFVTIGALQLKGPEGKNILALPVD